MSAPSWRHFTIERRIDILLRTEGDPASGAAWEQVCSRFRRVAIGMFLSGLLCGGILLGIEHGRAPRNLALLQAHEAADRGRAALDQHLYKEARAELRRGIDGGSDSATVWIWLAECERGLGREDEALKAEAIARRKGVTDPRLRLRLR
jgi:hypothetical protein